MQEVLFLKQNAEKWQEFEKLIDKSEKVDPDKLTDLFIELTDDLSFAQTFYPESKITIYLNQLTSKVHQKIYKNKKEDSSRILNFWKIELPLLMNKAHRYMVYSFAIFFVSVLIGSISSANDDTFVRLILGDHYVNMTLENISKDDPMAVYKKMNEVEMFLGITFNNIRVSLFAFVAGFFVSVGTVLLLFYNGVMLGAFHYMFFENDLLFTSMLTIWIHGTLEISAIIIAGAAGIIMGNSLLFPGTYSRLASFRKGAKNGLKIVIGLIPVFIAAGLLESFVTRHTEMPLSISLGIILLSLILVIFYFIIYPKKLLKGEMNAK